MGAYFLWPFPLGKLLMQICDNINRKLVMSEVYMYIIMGWLEMYMSFVIGVPVEGMDCDVAE